MVKKIRNDSIFKKPSIEKKRLTRELKIFPENKNKEYKKFYKFSIVSVVLILSFFSLPDVVNYFDENFVKNKTTINVSKKDYLCINK